MKIDLHCHSKHSRDNLLEPEAAIRAAHRRGLDGLCFTEHDSQWASWPAELVEAPEGFVVLRGVEISTDAGHLLAYGLVDDRWNLWDRTRYLPAREVIAVVHRLGGICVAAHPFRGYDSMWPQAEELEGVDAIETHNGRDGVTAQEKAVALADKLGVPSIGGSDAHRVEQVGLAYTELDSEPSTMSDLIAAILSGGCRGQRLEGVEARRR